MSVLCPCCNQPMADPNTADIRAVAEALSPKHRVVMELLISRYPNAARHEALIERVWGDDPGGGPLDPRVSLAISVTAIRKKIAPFGWTVANDWGTGFRLKLAEVEIDG